MTGSRIHHLIIALLFGLQLSCGGGGSGSAASSSSPVNGGYDISGVKLKAIAKSSNSSKTYLVGAKEENVNEPYARIFRLDSSGDIDPSFAANASDVKGLEIFEFSEFKSVIEQSDGKVLVFGTGIYAFDWVTYSHSSEAILIRFNEDGSIDQSFGTEGLVRTSLDVTNPNTSHSNADAISISILPDGHIITLVNNLWTLDPQVCTNCYGMDLNVIKYNSDGSLDTSFGVNGIVTTKHPDGYGGVGSSVIFGKDLLIMPDGKLLVAGYSFLAGNSSHDPRARNHFTLIKYRADGSLDPSFAGAGFLRLDQTHNDANDSGFYSLALQADGKILAGGYEDKNINNEWIQKSSIARFNSDGSIDLSFGNNGFVEIPAGPIRVPVGDLVEVNGKVHALVSNSGLGSYLYRFNSNGSSDSTFYENGRADLSNLPGAHGIYFGLTIDNLSNIWLGGTIDPENGFNVIKVESN